MRLTNKLFAYAAVMLTALTFAAARPAAADHMKDPGAMCCARDGKCMKHKDSKIGCCVYVACGEVGNRGFFTQTHCHSCMVHSGNPKAKGTCCCSSDHGPGHKMMPIAAFQESQIWPTDVYYWSH